MLSIIASENFYRLVLVNLLLQLLEILIKGLYAWLFYFVINNMVKTDKSDKKNLKSKDVNGKAVLEKWWEIAKWKLKYANQRWFFSLEDYEQSFIETTYLVVLQMCPQLEWEDYIERLRKAFDCNKGIKTVVKRTPIRWIKFWW